MSQDTGFKSGTGKSLKVSKESKQKSEQNIVKSDTSPSNYRSYYYKKKPEPPPLILFDIPQNTSNVSVEKIDVFLKKLKEPRKKKGYYSSGYYQRENETEKKRKRD